MDSPFQFVGYSLQHARRVPLRAQTTRQVVPSLHFEEMGVDTAYQVLGPDNRLNLPIRREPGYGAPLESFDREAQWLRHVA